ncbi:ParB/RepB/Spo0J family partition protein [Xanthomonas euvesicatoria]|uniref:ParB/RepB/Spo0J family partition protein n=1 Tax=Xanthomonas euvesicatoria TaxID=456327 RepID=UPI001C4740B2|nr:ParB/RepB/Spo0J family partition protein [Xanthomonas campestris pv. coriandri]MCE4330820.1 ParB/RepB/Spo0J family partition protein [Xanthomonas campestris pv. coriandri]
MSSKRGSFTSALQGLGDLGGFGEEHAADHAKVHAPSAQGTTMIDVALIDPAPGQTRKRFDPVKLQELADSIASKGMIQPVPVRVSPQDPGRYVLIAGERRLRAHKILKRAKIEVIVRDVEAASSDFQTLIENVQREDYEPYEVALGIQRAIDEHGASYATIGKELGKSKSWVSQHAVILRLPEQLLAVVQAGGIRDYTTIASAAKLYEAHPTAVMAALSTATRDNPYSRADLRQLEQSLKAPAPSPAPSPEASPSVQDPAMNRSDDGATELAPSQVEPSASVAGDAAPLSSAAPSSQAPADNGLPGKSSSPRPTQPQPKAAAKVIVANVDGGDELGYLDLVDVLDGGMVTVRRLTDGKGQSVAADTLRILRIDR